MVDGDEAHPGYRYGGMWKNKHAGVSAKMPKKVKEKQKQRGRQKNVPIDSTTKGEKEVEEKDPNLELDSATQSMEDP